MGIKLLLSAEGFAIPLPNISAMCITSLPSPILSTLPEAILFINSSCCLWDKNIKLFYVVEKDTLAPARLSRSNSIFSFQFYATQYWRSRALPYLCPPVSLCLKYPYFITTSNRLLFQTPTYSSGLNLNAIFCRLLFLCSFFISYTMAQICFYYEYLCVPLSSWY